MITIVIMKITLMVIIVMMSRKGAGKRARKNTQLLRETDATSKKCQKAEQRRVRQVRDFLCASLDNCLDSSLKDSTPSVQQNTRRRCAQRRGSTTWDKARGNYSKEDAVSHGTDGRGREGGEEGDEEEEAEEEARGEMEQNNGIRR